MIARLRAFAWLLLVSLDQLAHVAAFGAWWALTGRGSRPRADETISSRVGRNAIAGKRWALAAEWLIDGLFWLAAGKGGHCRANIEWDELESRP